MPNRTIYLPEELDQVSRRLDLNLSQVVQQAIRAIDAQRNPVDFEGEVNAASVRAQALAIDWSDFDLDDSRRGAGER